jgi:hypothetical protein
VDGANRTARPIGATIATSDDNTAAAVVAVLTAATLTGHRKGLEGTHKDHRRH